ncbi:septal ring lytic transglycosylase RlpA family protein [Paraburkholderia fungorum]|uniref:septal ring lytic transglycosylase RlpA family protein n=1 Tax=Paraburkholderia fungorum TaxID=134537 RepID=UPI0038BAEFBD
MRLDIVHTPVIQRSVSLNQVPAAFDRLKGGAMENVLHTTENRRPGRLPEVECVRLKAQPAQVLRALLFLVLSCGLGTAIPAPKPASTTEDVAPAKTATHDTAPANPKAAARDAAQASPRAATHDAAQASPTAPHHTALDRSGKARKGRASYYGRNFYTKKMADGTPMDPQSNIAASKTLPIGTKARVTNLQNGASEVVEIRDRGPYIKNRIVDVTPKTADKLGLKEDGTAPVVVKPIEVPQADGSVKAGAGAADTAGGKSSVDAQVGHSP